MMAPQMRQAAATRSTSAAAFSANGVSTTFLPRYRSIMAASGPFVSRPAIGWPGTNCAILSFNAARAASTTSDLVLPASVTTVPGCRCGAIDARMAPVCATGAATSTRSAPWMAWAMSPPISSMMPSSSARAIDACERPMPTTVPTAPMCLRARANEPPIRPTPKITTLLKTGVAIQSSQRFRQRGDEDGVFLRQADGNTQPLRQAIAAHRAHDHALLQQRQVHARAGAVIIAHFHQHEIAVRRHEFQAQLSKCFRELLVAGRVVARAFFQEFLVVQGG